MSVGSSFAILFESKYALLKKSPNVLFKVSTSNVLYKKNGKHNTGKVSYGGFSAGQKQDKRTTVFFLAAAWLKLSARMYFQDSIIDPYGTEPTTTR
jgi:hypothetical protein